MSYSPLDDYESNTDVAYCSECQKEVEIKRVDHGIGPYEFWGAKGYHHDWQWECSECGSLKLTI